MSEGHTSPMAEPDVDLRVGSRRLDLRRAAWGTLSVISAGGALGALARYGLATALPHKAGGFDWATLWTNIVGCFLIGVLMVAITEIWQAHPLVRPFLGVGILGGFTTFSTFIVDVQSSIETGRPATGLGYLAATALSALAAVTLGVHLTRLLARRKETRS